MSAVNSVHMEDGETEKSEEMLVSVAISGDATAFVQLSKRHASKVFQAAYRVTRNRQDAEDALQDAFLKAFQHMKDFQGRSSFSTWLTRIAINSALMILRKKRGGFEISIDHTDSSTGGFETWEPRSSVEDPESRYVRRERQKKLRQAIHRLPPVLREAIELRHVNDCSAQEIAQSLGITVSAVKSRLTRGKSALRTSLIPTASESLSS